MICPNCSTYIPEDKLDGLTFIEAALDYAAAAFEVARTNGDEKGMNHWSAEYVFFNRERMLETARRDEERRKTQPTLSPTDTWREHRGDGYEAVS